MTPVKSGFKHVRNAEKAHMKLNEKQLLEITKGRTHQTERVEHVEKRYIFEHWNV